MAKGDILNRETVAAAINSMAQDGYAPGKTQYDQRRSRGSIQSTTILLRLGYVTDANGWAQMVSELTGLPIARTYTLPKGKGGRRPTFADDDTPEMIRATALEEARRGLPVCRLTVRNGREYYMLR